ncbi:hypothetical protein J1614_001658 [Plenodomus biglobosus]|nr:hypothetical protein J1614_001658 [Plenodomus biglobosus]
MNTIHLVRKGGIPVLAYPKHDPASPISLTFVVTYHHSSAQATFYLQCSPSVQDRNEPQAFILQYSADNFVSGSLSLESALIALPPQRLNEVGRHGKPQMRTLCLSLKNVCPVWCPLTPVTPAFQSEFQTSLTNLAKATDLMILFDYNWVHHDMHVYFQRLVEHTEEFTGCPVPGHFGKLYRRLDWKVFSIGEADAHVDGDVATDDEEPPPVYAEVNNKRGRYASTSPTPASPPAKRLLSSYLRGSPTILNTPTEKESISTQSPMLLQSPVTPPNPNFLPFTALKTGSSPELSSSLDAAILEVDSAQAVEQAVSTLLPSVVETLLPNVLESILPRLLTLSSPATPLSQQLMESQCQEKPPTPPVLSAFTSTFGDYVAGQIKGELSRLYADSLAHWNYLRHEADEDFQDVFNDQKIEVVMEKEAAIAEVEKVISGKLQEFKGMCELIIEELGETAGDEAEVRASKVVDHMMQRLDKWGREDKTNLERGTEELLKNREKAIRDKEHIMRAKEKLLKLEQKLWREKRDVKKKLRALRREQKRFEKEKRRWAEQSLRLPPRSGLKSSDNSDPVARLRSMSI